MAERDSLISVRPVSKPTAKVGLPDIKVYGEEVPKGGSMCMNCEYLSDDKKHCRNENFIAWKGSDKPAGSDKLPKPADRYCSIWWHAGEEEE